MVLDMIQFAFGKSLNHKHFNMDKEKFPNDLRVKVGYVGHGEDSIKSNCTEREEMD